MQSTLPDQSPSLQPNRQPNLLPQQPLGVGDLIDRSFRLYRRHFKVFLYTAAILVLPLSVVSGILAQSVMQNQLTVLAEVFQGGGTDFASLQQATLANNTVGFVALQVVLGMLSLIAWVLTFLALNALAIRTLRGETPSVSLAYEGAKRTFWPAVRLGILVFLAFMGAAIVLSLILVLIGLLGGGVLGGLLGGLDSGDSSTAAVGGVVFAMCCLLPLLFAAIVAPLAYLGARWSVTLPAMIDEGLGARASLRRSWRLAEGSIWRIIGYNMLIWVLTFILFAVPFYLLQGLMLLIVGVGQVWIAAVFGTIMSVVLNVIWLPMTAIFPVLLYFDLRNRASGGDISARLDRLEATLGAPADLASGIPPAATAGPYPTLAPAPSTASLHAPVAPGDDRYSGETSGLPAASGPDARPDMDES